MQINELIAYLLTPIAQVSLIMGLAEVCKRADIIKTKYIPILDLVIGVVLGVVIDGVNLGYGVVNGVLVGIALGLSACGLFSGIKNITDKEAGNDD